MIVACIFGYLRNFLDCSILYKKIFFFIVAARVRSSFAYCIDIDATRPNGLVIPWECAQVLAPVVIDAFRPNGLAVVMRSDVSSRNASCADTNVCQTIHIDHM